MSATDPVVVLLDLGGVLFDLDPARCLATWSRHSGIGEAELARRGPLGPYAARYERGEITTEEFCSELRLQLGADLSDAALLEGWNALLAGVEPSVAAALKTVAAERPCYALTNTNAAHQAAYAVRFSAALSPFRAIFASHELGVAKPDLAAFAAAFAAMEVAPSSVVFFDDLAVNCDAARSLGATAVEVRRPDDAVQGLLALRP